MRRGACAGWGGAALCVYQGWFRQGRPPPHVPHVAFLAFVWLVWFLRGCGVLGTLPSCAGKGDAQLSQSLLVRRRSRRGGRRRSSRRRGRGSKTQRGKRGQSFPWTLGRVRRCVYDLLLGVVFGTGQGAVCAWIRGVGRWGQLGESEKGRSWNVMTRNLPADMTNARARQNP